MMDNKVKDVILEVLINDPSIKSSVLRSVKDLHSQLKLKLKVLNEVLELIDFEKDVETVMVNEDLNYDLAAKHVAGIMNSYTKPKVKERFKNSITKQLKDLETVEQYLNN